VSTFIFPFLILKFKKFFALPFLTFEQIEEELAGLRKDFLLNNKCKMLVLVSMATNEMIRLVSMYPEVWFLDTTAGESISFII